MKKKLVIFSLLLLFYSICNGQVLSISKLKKQLPFIKDSLRYVDVLNRLGILSYEENVDSSFYFTSIARSIANRLDYPKGKADAADNLAIIYDMKGNLQLALRYYNEAYNRYSLLDDSSNMVQTMMNIASVYNELGKDIKSIQGFKNAITFGRHLKKDSIMSLVYANFILAYPGNIQRDSTLFYIQKARQIASKYKDIRLLLAVDQLTADYYIKNNQRDKGIALLQQTINKVIDSKLYYLSLDMLIDIGDVYAPSDSTKAVKYYKQGLEISDEKDYAVYKKLINKKLYDFYLSKKDNTNAFRYSQKLVALNEQQEKTNNNSGVDFIQYALKDQQLESAYIQSKYQRYFIFFALLVSILSIYLMLIAWRNSKKMKNTAELLRLQVEQSEYTMGALDIMNKNYTRLIKVVAHDLRNPIGAISTLASLIDPEEMESVEILELLNLVQTSSSNCLDLINELLRTDFDEQQNLKKELINPDELLQQCVRLLNYKALEKNQQLILNTNLHTAIIGDNEKFGRVINNLIVNAIKFSPEGSNIYIDTKEQERKICISVKDTGMGIPAGIQDKIFEPFTTAKRAGTDGEQPYGLGLYISKQIIEAHQGKIWVESQEGFGTTFYIEVPAISVGKQAVLQQ